MSRLPSKSGSSAAAAASSSPVFNPLDYVTENLNEEEILKVKQIFDVFDSDRSGSISPKEMQEAIKRLNMESEA